MQSSNNRYSNGVNQAGKAIVDEQVKVRYKETSKNPFVLAFTNILNSFGNMISPVKEKK